MNDKRIITILVMALVAIMLSTRRVFQGSKSSGYRNLKKTVILLSQQTK